MTSFPRIKAASLAAGLMVIAGPSMALAQVAVSDLPEIVVTETTKLPEGHFPPQATTIARATTQNPKPKQGFMFRSTAGASSPRPH